MINFELPDSSMMEQTEWVSGVVHSLLFLFFPVTLGGTLVCTLRQTFLRREMNNDEFARWRHILYYLIGALAVLLGMSILLALATHGSMLLYMGEPLAPFLLFGILGLLLLTVVPIFTGGKRKKRFRALRYWMMSLGLLLLSLSYLGADAWCAHPVGAQFDIATLSYKVDDYGAILLNPTAWLRGVQLLITSFLSGMVLLGMLSPSRRNALRVLATVLLLAACVGMDYLLLQNETEERPYTAAVLKGDPFYRYGALRVIPVRIDTARKTVLDPINYYNGKQYMNLEAMRRSEEHFVRHRSTMGYSAYSNPRQYLPPRDALYYASRIHLYALLVLLVLTVVNGYERSRTGIGLTTGLLAAMTVSGSLLWVFHQSDMPWIVHEQLTTASIVQSHYYAPLTIVGRVLFAFFMVLLLFFLIYLKQQRNYTQK